MRLKLIIPLVLCLTGTGCEQLNFNFRGQSLEEEREKKIEEYQTKIENKLVGDFTTIAGLNVVTLEGVGLVTGLNGTGGDPPPSSYRNLLLDAMRKNGVPNPNRVISDPTTAMVRVQAFLPPLVRKGDTFDVHVTLIGGGESTSLAGGWLVECALSEHAMVPGAGVMKGHILARAAGPILITADEEGGRVDSRVLRKGRVLGGAVSTKDRDLSLYLRNDYRMGRIAQRVEDAIGARFYHYNSAGSREALAEAKTDQLVELQLHPRYRDNFPRYLQVVRSIASKDTAVTLRMRMQRLQAELNDPKTSYKASLQLEAIGQPSVRILKAALYNPDREVQFYSALALAYLGDISGLDILAKAAKEEPAFRIYALAAMAATEDSEANIKLRELLHGDSTETRYGAFRALTTLDRNDPFIRGERLNTEHPRGAFMLHVLETRGTPMVHLTYHKKSEVVLFGAHQQFETPLTARAGNFILVTAAPGSDSITVSKFMVGQQDEIRTTSRRIADVVRAVAELGGTYPDVASLLMQADRQGNLPGELGLDALPQAGRNYVRETVKDGQTTQRNARIGSENTAPNLFGALNPFKKKRSGDSLAERLKELRGDDGEDDEEETLSDRPAIPEEEEQDTDSPEEESRWAKLNPFRALKRDQEDEEEPEANFVIDTPTPPGEQTEP